MQVIGRCDIYILSHINQDKKPSLAIFFYLGFKACQAYFTHFEPSQSLDGAKMGDPRERLPDQERLPDHPQAELSLKLDHICTKHYYVVMNYYSKWLSYRK